MAFLRPTLHEMPSIVFETGNDVGRAAFGPNWKGGWVLLRIHAQFSGVQYIAAQQNVAQCIAVTARRGTAQ